MKYLSFVIIIISCLQGCFSGQQQIFIASDAVAADRVPGACPFITKDNNGNIVLSWIRQTDSLSNVFCYAVSNDGGKFFNAATVIPGSSNVHPHGENMPKLLFKP